MAEALFDDRELPEEGNRNPQQVVDGFGYVSTFLSLYGWYIILAILGLLYLRNFFSSRIEKSRQERERDSSLSQYDASTVLSRQEAQDRARQRMQAEHDDKLADHLEKQKQKEEEKRKEQIEDWERHQRGQGYRSKKLNKEDDSKQQSASGTSANKPKKPSMRGGYNPLMGGTGSGFRPPRSTRSGGG